MSDFQRNDMTGTIFINDYKSTDNQPDMRGDALVSGVEYKVAVWHKTSANGKEYQSMSFQTLEEAEKYKKEGDSNEKTHQSNKSEDTDLPF